MLRQIGVMKMMKRFQCTVLILIFHEQKLDSFSVAGIGGLFIWSENGFCGGTEVQDILMAHVINGV